METGCISKRIEEIFLGIPSPIYNIENDEKEPCPHQVRPEQMRNFIPNKTNVQVSNLITSISDLMKSENETKDTKYTPIQIEMGRKGTIHMGPTNTEEERPFHKENNKETAPGTPGTRYTLHKAALENNQDEVIMHLTASEENLFNTDLDSFVEKILNTSETETLEKLLYYLLN